LWLNKQTKKLHTRHKQSEDPSQVQRMMKEPRFKQPGQRGGGRSNGAGTTFSKRPRESTRLGDGKAPERKKLKSDKSVSPDDDDPLGGLLKEMGQHSSSQRANRITSSQVATAFKQTFTECLHRANIGQDGLEVEIRFGLLIEGRFIARVEEEEFMRVREWLSTMRPRESHSRTTDVSYKVTNENNQSYRVQTNVDTNAITAQTKTVKQRANFCTQSMLYDLRFGVSVEKAVEIDQHLHLQKPISKRNKERWSFALDEWGVQVDLTMVTPVIINYQKQICQDVVHEIEIELLPSRSYTDEFITKLWTLVFEIMEKMRGTNLKADIPTTEEFDRIQSTKVVDATELKKRLYQGISTLKNPSALNFPGSMPVNFSRRHFPLLQKNSYFVSEKTDGIRYLLFITNSGSYLVDRKFDFFRIENFDELTDTYQSENNEVTIVDGELIKRRDSKGSLYFLIFDITILQGKHCAHLPLADRFRVMDEFCQIFWKMMLSKPEHTRATFPFIIHSKKFHDLKNFSHVVACIQKHDSHYCYSYKNKMKHYTDGFIFAPNKAYAAFTVPSLLKWKFIDKLSLDILVSQDHYDNKKRLNFQFNGNSSLVDCPMTFLEADKIKIIRELRRKAKKDKGIVVETCYDAKKGCWIFSGVRTDKAIPNHVSVVFETLQCIAENVTIKELEYRLSRDYEKDDWEVKVAQAMDSLI